MKRVMGIAVCIIAFAAGAALAHEGEVHGRHQDAQMAKLHKMMPRYEESRAKIAAALTKGDLAAVNAEAAYLLSTASDLKKSKPHKHAKERAEFQKVAEAFEKEVKKTAESAKKGDVDAARTAFAGAQARCEECHKRFRD